MRLASDFPAFAPGDILGFSGRHWASYGINLCTYGVPGWGLSHVGIVSYVDGPTAGLRCLDSDYGEGVSHTEISTKVNEYEGRVWHYQLTRPLYLYEVGRLTRHASSFLGRPYDSGGALKSGGKIVALVNAILGRESVASLFCSEYVAECLNEIGIFPTGNVSRWSPNHLMRRLRAAGIIHKPRRLK
jgi:hypothetical protein